MIKLGLTLLDEKPNFFAAQVGILRLSFFGGHTLTGQSAEKYVGTSIIFSTDNIEKTRNKLIELGIELSVDITNANDYPRIVIKHQLNDNSP